MTLLQAKCLYAIWEIAPQGTILSTFLVWKTYTLPQGPVELCAVSIEESNLVMFLLQNDVIG